MFSDTLNKFITELAPPLSETINRNISDKNHDQINIKNFATLTKGIVNYADSRLRILRTKLDAVHTLLPTDEHFDEQHNRHKRFIFMIPMIICEVNKAAMHQVKLERQKESDAIQAELDAYKIEYERLYQDTMPDLIPDYIKNNKDDITNDTIDFGVEYLTRTRRDVKFLMSIIEQKNGKHILENKPPPNEPEYSYQDTTPNPHIKYNPKFARLSHKFRPLSKSYMSPGKVYVSNFNAKKSDDGESILKSFFDNPLNLGKSTTSSTTTTLTTTKSIPNSTTSTAPETTPAPSSRRKRFDIGSAILSGVLGTFFGLFSQFEINRLRNNLNDMSNKQNLLVQITQNHEIQIQKVKHSLEELTTVFTLFIKNNPALLYAELNDKLMLIQDHITKFRDTIQMLQLQRLSTNTLSYHQLTYAYETLQATARANNLTPLTNRPQDIYQLDTSYIRVKNQIIIIVHVPCSNPENLLTIYKYVPFPIPVLPTHHNNIQLNTIQDVFNIDRTDSATEGIHFTPPSDLIAIGKNDNNRHRYILLSSADLQACTKRPQAYICERHQVTRSDLLGSCLGSLYMQSAVGVFENCKIDRVNLREQVYQISNTEHIIYSPIPISTQIFCNNGSYFNIKIKQVKQIYVPEGCSVDLTNHTITSDFSIRLNSESIHFEWDFNPLNFPNSASFLIDAKSIDTKLQLLQNSLKLLSNDTIEPQEFSNLMLTHYSSGHWSTTLILILVSLSALVGMFTIFICARNIFLARGRIAAEVVQLRRRHTESDDDVEDEITRLARQPTAPPRNIHEH